MTTARELGTIEKVGDIREYWPHEANDFTPWLARNISILGDALGMELETQEQEAPVGAFSLDIRAHDIENRQVAIENQFGATDHRHLGQLLTYATGSEADVVVWIAEEFRDEHRATLDYLNQRTEETWEFFGVVVELWKIDESRAAPYFRLVATPNDWRKKAASVNSKANSELGERYRDFYRGLIEKLVETRFSGSREAPPRNIMDFGSGYSAFKYRAYISKQRARIAAYIDSSDYEWNKSLFDQIEEEKLEIESEIGASLEWDRSDNNRYSLISTVNARGIEEEQEILSEIQDWMVDRLLKFREVFGPRLAELVD